MYRIEQVLWVAIVHNRAAIMSVQRLEGMIYVPSPFQLEMLTSSDFFLYQCLAWEENQRNTAVMAVLDICRYLYDHT